MLTSAEIEKKLKNSELPFGGNEEDGSGRGLCVSSDGDKYLYCYRTGRINDWKVLNWEKL